MHISQDRIEQILSTWPVARFATLDENGAPALIPIVFSRSGNFLWSPVDGKPKSSRALARLSHVDRDPRVSLLLDHYDTDWRRLWWVRITGEAVVCRFAKGENRLLPIENALRNKYPQYETTPLFFGEPTLIRISIRDLRSWCFSEQVFLETLSEIS